MIHITLVYYFVFASLTQIGGVMGFVRAKSQASLIAGLISGALLDLAGALLVIFPASPKIGLVTGGVVSLLLLGRFAPAFFKTKKLFPAGMMFFLGTASVILTLVAWAGI